jgi:hypothetical protein
MSYKSVKQILNAVFDSENDALRTAYKEEGEVFNLVLDESGEPALRVSISGLTSDGTVSTSIIDGEAATYADLPDAADHAGDIYIVQSTTGVLLINKKQAGMYLSDGLTWSLLDVDLQADKVYYSGELTSGNVMDALDELKGITDDKSDTDHTHDDTYYTESEVDTLLESKLDTSAQAADSAKLEGLSTNNSGVSFIPYVDEDGNFIIIANKVGIGTSTPDQALHFYKNSTGSLRYKMENSEGSVEFLANDSKFSTILNNTLMLELSETYFAPVQNNVTTLGKSGAAWSILYVDTGTVSSSDARLKTDVQEFTEAEISASITLGKEIGTYKFLASIEEKSDEARLHIGMTVQKAIEILESFDLDPFAYGFICYDQWEAEEAQYDEDGKMSKQAVEAGDRYSFRYNELNQFILRGIIARLEALEELS